MTQLPNAPPYYDQALFQRIVGAISSALGGCWQKRQDVRLVNGERLTLKSPDGHEYAVKVDNAGALSTTLVS